ncbi:hypothetical protein BGZ61DRAFT_526835 [Ilyonectria robusta]|uniref:uncharacterized protein n=1 Tax=Ilyonectria robusta TaxID=1079257 RepID=UPI001E8D7481|nr:uncharacterized protein BGZ61DRAFT_526835 [Ilyonectria robusta]KAH8735804.1 hypothetical protein BGZ61DRAFT_526835 [Ilyonectria robusta]
MSQQPKPSLAADFTTCTLDTPDIQHAVSKEDADGGVTPRSHDLGLCNIPRHRFLTHAEWAVLAHGVGGVKDAENQAPLHPVLMILQLFLGASLTGLGSLSLQHGTPITILGAANTIIAGLLAFLHNSGLPDRYGYNMAEFREVEDHIREILDTAMVPTNHTIDQALAECFDMYQHAKATVLANKPMTYTTSGGLQAGRRFVPPVGPGPTPTVQLPRVKGQGGGGSGAEAAK